MLLSRSDATSETLPSHLICIVVSLAVLSLFSTQDAFAVGPLKSPTMSIFNDVSFEKSLNESLPLRSRAIVGSLKSPGGKTGGVFTGNLNSVHKYGAVSSSLNPNGNPLRTLSLRIVPGGIGKARQPVSERLEEIFKPILTSGATYRFGSEGRDNHLTMDFFLPALLYNSSLWFVESRAEYQGLFSDPVSSSNQQFDFGLGLGWRKIGRDGAMFGINAFWDASRLRDDWYSSPGFGVELALPVSSGVWDVVLNAYRGGGIDLKSGFTFPVFEDRLDMRLYAEKYRFFDGEFILGSKFGAEISTPDRLLTVSYTYGQDSKDPNYHAVACSLAVPFRIENVFCGKNPFEQPERPAARRLQSEGVKRAWRQPDTVVEARNTVQGERWTTPGKLTDFWSTKSGTAATQTADKSKNDSKTCQNPRTGEYQTEKASGESSSLGAALLFLLGKGSTGGGIAGAACAVGATYLSCDYAYRSAFGPFEIEPYEKERIKQEMPKKQRQRK
jgi:hypothetical protein